MKNHIAKFILKFHNIIDITIVSLFLILPSIFSYIIFEPNLSHHISMILVFLLMIYFLNSMSIKNIFNPNYPIRDFVINIFFKNWTIEDIGKLKLSNNMFEELFGIDGINTKNKHIINKYFISKSKFFVEKISEECDWDSRDEAPIKYTIPHKIFEKAFLKKEPCYVFRLFIKEHKEFNYFILKNPEMNQYIID